MRIGILSNSLDIPTGLADLVRQVADAELEGFESFWLPQGFGANVLVNLYGESRAKAKSVL